MQSGVLIFLFCMSKEQFNDPGFWLHAELFVPLSGKEFATATQLKKKRSARNCREKICFLRLVDTFWYKILLDVRIPTNLRLLSLFK